MRTTILYLAGASLDYTMVTLIIINISHPFHMYVQISSAHRNGCPLHPQQNIGGAVGYLFYITVKAN